jgi:hypothetical protein
MLKNCRFKAILNANWGVFDIQNHFSAHFSTFPIDDLVKS